MDFRRLTLLYGDNDDVEFTCIEKTEPNLGKKEKEAATMAIFNKQINLFIVSKMVVQQATK
jgi:hypothetical protein